MDKRSSEQHFHKSNVITFAVYKFWSHTPSTTRSYGRLAGRLADKMCVNFLKFVIDQILKLFTVLNEVTALLEQYECV